MVLFNFRADRMVEISKAFEYEDFTAFDRKRFPKVPDPHQDAPAKAPFMHSGPFACLWLPCHLATTLLGPSLRPC